MSSKVTIQTLKEQTPPQSPRKCNETLHCAVLTKSLLKPTRFGKMFTMSLCEEDPSRTIRAVCFEENMFGQFNMKESYDLQSFKLKKGINASNNDVELVIDHTTSIKKAADQFDIEKQFFTIAEILRKESQGHRFINITAKVTCIEDVCLVGKHPNIMEKRDVHLADESGLITMVLWRQRACNFGFSVDDAISLENVVTTLFNNQIMLTTASESVIEKVDMDINIPATAKLPSRKRSLISSLESSVLAIKGFKAVYRCFSCKGEIDCKAAGKGNSGLLITCPTCSTVFLASSSSLSN